MNSAIKATPFITACCIFLAFVGLLGVRSGSTKGLIDFQSFYAAGYQVRTNPSQLYNLAQQQRTQQGLTSTKGFLPFYHPSYEALIFVPYSFLRYRTAYFTYLVFNMFVLIAVFFAARPAFSADASWLQSRPDFMFFLFLPTLLAALTGQDSFLSLLIYCLAWRQLEAGRDMSAGCFLALALFKFQIAIPVAVLIAVRRGRRFAAGWLIAFAAIAVICIGIVGMAGTAEYIRLLSGAATAMHKSAIVKQRMGVYPSSMPNLTGFFYFCARHLKLSSAISSALTVACTIGLFAWCFRVVRCCEQRILYPIAILFGLLVSYHLFIYDLTLALLAVTLLAGRTSRFILLAFFCLPLVLLPFGSNSFSLLALPLLVMLIYTLVSTPKSAAFVTEIAQVASI